MGQFFFSQPRKIIRIDKLFQLETKKIKVIRQWNVNIYYYITYNSKIKRVTCDDARFSWLITKHLFAIYVRHCSRFFILITKEKFKRRFHLYFLWETTYFFKKHVKNSHRKYKTINITRKTSEKTRIKSCALRC